jgi:hypothetical protein
MVTLGLLVQMINSRKNRLLLVAEAALPPTQFQAFRRVVLDEFGKSGLERELEQAFAEDCKKDKHGQGRNT